MKIRAFFDSIFPSKQKLPKEEKELRPWNWETDNPEVFNKSKRLFDMVMRDFEQHPPHEWESIKLLPVSHYTHPRIDYGLHSYSGGMAIVYENEIIWLIRPHAHEIDDKFSSEIDEYDELKRERTIQKLLDLAS